MKRPAYSAVVFFDPGDGLPGVRSRNHTNLFNAKHWVEETMKMKHAVTWTIQEMATGKTIDGPIHPFKFVPIWVPGLELP